MDAAAPLQRPLVLGIESSCDDTACAILDGDGRVLASVVSSQLKAHRPYGGVVPEIASREHLAAWPRVSDSALAEAGIEMADLDIVAATRGPGLVGSLLVGLSLGKALAFALQRPFHGVHHLEGHLFSPYLRLQGEAPAPVPDHFVGLVVSGGHTSLYRVQNSAAGREVITLGETRDDAMGEVFDKVGKRLGLPYPQGPIVDRLAEEGDAAAHPLPVARCGDTLDFSYSGLKSQTLLEIEKLERRGIPSQSAGGTEAGDFAPEVLNLIAGFRAAAAGQILARLQDLHRREPIEHLAVSGGAAANRLLRRQLQEWAEEEGLELALVPLTYAGDNAAMIAHAALLRHRLGLEDDPITADAASRIPIRSASAAEAP
jgi:N6-L-threonylcarbamoyladenine synthase